MDTAWSGIVEAGVAALFAAAIAMIVTYLVRRKSIHAEDGSIKWKQLTRDWVFVAVMLVVFVGIRTNVGRTKKEWKPFNSAVGGFSVLDPGTPKEERKALDSVAGPVELHLFSFEPGGAFNFGVAVADIPPGRLEQGAEVILSDTVAGMANRSGDRVISEVRIVLEDHPGRQFMVQRQQGDTTRARVYVIRDRLYMLVVNAAPGHDSSDDAVRFLDSFKLQPR